LEGSRRGGGKERRSEPQQLRRCTVQMKISMALKKERSSLHSLEGCFRKNIQRILRREVPKISR